MEKDILREDKGSTTIVKFNRPEALNALNEELLGHFEKVLDQLQNDEHVKVIILTGAGDRSFIAGADIRQMAAMGPAAAKRFSNMGQRIMARIEALDKIVIAAINGYCLGGGCEIALAADIRVASSAARIGTPEVTLGIIPGFGGTQRLSRLVGLGFAKEIIVTGKPIDATRALQIGLVNHVVPNEELMVFCQSLAETIAKNSGNAIASGKHAMTECYGMDLKRAIEMESLYFAQMFTHPDQKEGMGAFLEKRKANFRS